MNHLKNVTLQQRHDGANPVPYEARDLFPGLEYPSNVRLPVYGWDKAPANKAIFAAKLQGGYIPDIDALRQIACSLVDGTPLCLVGPQGAGKSTAVIETLVRANWEIEIMTAHKFAEPMDLCGSRFQSADGTWRYEMNELLDAYVNGKALLMEERDNLNSASTTFLNSFLDRSPVRVPFLEGVAKPHPNCRVFGTANTVGNGEGIDVFTSSEVVSPAANRRWAMAEVDYMNSVEEGNLLERMFPDEQIGAPVRDFLVNFAGKTREAAKEGTVLPFSTGELVMCATRLALLGTARLQEVLAATYFVKMRSDQRAAAEEMFGTLGGEAFFADFNEEAANV